MKNEKFLIKLLCSFYSLFDQNKRKEILKSKRSAMKKKVLTALFLGITALGLGSLGWSEEANDALEEERTTEQEETASETVLPDEKEKIAKVFAAGHEKGFRAGVQHAQAVINNTLAV